MGFSTDFTGTNGDAWPSPWVTMASLAAPSIQGNTGDVDSGEGGRADSGESGDRDVDYSFGWNFPDVGVSWSATATTTAMSGSFLNNAETSNSFFTGELTFGAAGTTSGLGAVNGDVCHVHIEIRSGVADIYVWLNSDPMPGTPSIAGYTLTYDGPHVAAAAIAGGYVDDFSVAEATPPPEPPVIGGADPGAPGTIVTIFDLIGTTVVAAIANPIEPELEERLQENETLRFALPFDDERNRYIALERVVRFDARYYRITRVEDDHDGPQALTRVEAEALWIDLQNITRRGEFTVGTGDSETDIATILDGTGWTAAASGPSIIGYTPTITKTDATVLELLREFASAWPTGLDEAGIISGELVFDTAARTVALALISQGDDENPNAFRYSRNLRNIKRETSPPAATRLYPTGAEGVVLADPGYLENFDYYTDVLGLTLEDAQASFTREAGWSDARIPSTDVLEAIATYVLAGLAYPKVTYEMTVADLSSYTGLDGETYGLGDKVRVFDEVLGIDTRTRIVRKVTYPAEPHRNIIELSARKPELVDVLSPSPALQASSITPPVEEDPNATRMAFADLTQVIDVFGDDHTPGSLWQDDDHVDELSLSQLLGRGEVVVTKRDDGDARSGFLHINFKATISSAAGATDLDPIDFLLPRRATFPNGEVINFQARTFLGNGVARLFVAATETFWPGQCYVHANESDPLFSMWLRAIFPADAPTLLADGDGVEMDITVAIDEDA